MWRHSNDFGQAGIRQRILLHIEMVIDKFCQTVRPDMSVFPVSRDFCSLEKDIKALRGRDL